MPTPKGKPLIHYRHFIKADPSSGPRVCAMCKTILKYKNQTRYCSLHKTQFLVANPVGVISSL